MGNDVCNKEVIAGNVSVLEIKCIITDFISSCSLIKFSD